MSLSIQKMVSDGTLSTIVLGVQYLQRNDVYLRIAGVETPQSGAPSGYTWSFLDNNTIRVLPVVPAGVEVVVYRRTDLDAMYNIYSQNAQFDESTIDENNQQLLFIAQEYFEQGVPAQLIERVEYIREDTTNMYYRLKLSDGKYTAEFPIPKVGAAGFMALRRTYADAGLTLVDGSFETGGTLSSDTDVLLHNVTAKAYAWTGSFPHVVAPGTDPAAVAGFVMRSDVGLRGEISTIVRRLSSVSAMKADSTLKVGQVVETISYLDGWAALSLDPLGGNRYVIVPAGTGVDDGGSFINLPGSGLQAKALFHKNSKVTYYHFGAHGDGIADDTIAVQNAHNYTRAPKGKGKFLISDCVNITQAKARIGCGGDTEFIANSDFTMFYIRANWVKFKDAEFTKTVTSQTFHIYSADNIQFKLLDCELSAPVGSKHAGLAVGTAAHFSKTGLASGMQDSTHAAQFMTHVERCLFKQGQVWLTHSDSRIKDNFIWAGEVACNFDFAVRLSNTSNIKVSGNDIVPSSGYGGGIALYKMDMVRIENNFFDGSYDGVYTKTGVADIGIAPCGYIRITDNVFWEIAEQAINLQLSSRITISDNTFLNCNKANAGFADIRLGSLLTNTSANISGNVHSNTQATSPGLAFEFLQTGSNYLTGHLVDNEYFGNYSGTRYTIAGLVKNRIKIDGNTIADTGRRFGVSTIAAGSTTAFPRWAGFESRFTPSYSNLKVLQQCAGGNPVQFRIESLAADGFNIVLAAAATVPIAFYYEYEDRP